MSVEATPAYRLLTSLSSLLGVNGLEGINTHPLNQGALVLVGAALFRLDRDSLDPPDGVNVIEPLAGPGRWLRFVGDEGPQGPQGAQGPQGDTGVTAVSYDFGLYEARPLESSAAYSDLHLWSWTDENFPGTAGQTGATDLTLQDYRDTNQIKAFFRYDQDNEINIDYQLKHEWAKTAVRLHLHLVPMGSADGDAYFTGRFFFGGPVDVLPAAVGWTPIATIEPILGVNQYKRQLAEICVCPPPVTPGSSSILSVHLIRNGTSATDTYTSNKDHGTPQANLCLESYDIHYQRYLVGSEEEASGVLHANPARLFFDPAWSPGSVYLQVVVKSDLGNACSFQLYDVTGAAAVAGSVVTVSSASYAMVEVGPLALGAGTRDYIIQGKYDGAADEPKLAWARFVVR
jgi:hypothetical protein